MKGHSTRTARKQQKHSALQNSAAESRDSRFREILSIDTELNNIRDQDILLEKILSVARSLTRADAGSIYIRHGSFLEIKFAQNDTFKKQLENGHKIAYTFFKVPINTESIAGYVAQNNTKVNIVDYYNIPKDAPFSHNTKYDKDTGYKTESMYATALTNSVGQCLGVLQIINKKSKGGDVLAFTADDEELLLHFANSAIIALEKAQLTRTILHRMVQMAELRDPKETGPHVNRVAGYSLEIYDRWAYKMKIPASTRRRERDLFRMASMLHDVGKVGISDVILKKPGKLDPEEYEIMKTHTQIGSTLFNNSDSEFDRVAQIVVLNHHENWDGTGYPNQKRGKEIPLLGRIVSIADVYDALRSRRVYKESWSEEDVLHEMRTLSGKKFDPFLLEIFFEVYANLQNISAQYLDE